MYLAFSLTMVAPHDLDLLFSAHSDCFSEEELQMALQAKLDKPRKSRRAKYAKKETPAEAAACEAVFAVGDLVLPQESLGFAHPHNASHVHAPPPEDNDEGVKEPSDGPSWLHVLPLSAISWLGVLPQELEVWCVDSVHLRGGQPCRHCATCKPGARNSKLEINGVFFPRKLIWQ